MDVLHSAPHALGSFQGLGSGAARRQGETPHVLAPVGGQEGSAAEPAERGPRMSSPHVSYRQGPVVPSHYICKVLRSQSKCCKISCLHAF